jgi:hypothetical protein
LQSRFIYSPRIVAEQKSRGMSQAMIHKLEAFAVRLAAAGGPIATADVDLMITRQGSID